MVDLDQFGVTMTRVQPLARLNARLQRVRFYMYPNVQQSLLRI